MYKRKNTRLPDYDYSGNGFYFITVCTKNRENLFGEIKNGEMILNWRGEIVKECLEQIPNHLKNAFLDIFTIMPNHVHAILIIENIDALDVGNSDHCSLQVKLRFYQ